MRQGTPAKPEMRRWYAVHTQPHGEARARVNLERQGYETYLPRCRKLRRHARRSDVVAAPLFPRYLFVCLDVAAERWRPILSTFGVSSLVTCDGAPVALPDGVIEGIRGREDSDQFVDLARQAALRPGDQIRLLAGPFANRVARFEGLDEARRVFVLLEMLGRPLRVSVEPECIAACA